jgi:hypothetical protein
MTPSTRGDDAAASADTNERQRLRPAMLVRFGGRWLCRHELTTPTDSHDPSPNVQLRP